MVSGLFDILLSQGVERLSGLSFLFGRALTVSMAQEKPGRSRRSNL